MSCLPEEFGLVRNVCASPVDHYTFKLLNRAVYLTLNVVLEFVIIMPLMRPCHTMHYSTLIVSLSAYSWIFYFRLHV